MTLKPEQIPEDLNALWNKVQGAGVIETSFLVIRELVERIATLEAALKEKEKGAVNILNCVDDYYFGLVNVKACKDQIELLDKTIAGMHENDEAQERKIAALRSQVERLSKPVTDEEWIEFQHSPEGEAQGLAPAILCNLAPIVTAFISWLASRKGSEG